MERFFTLKLPLLIGVLLLLVQLPCYSQAVLGTDTKTQIKVFEYYNHVPSEWIKLFRIENQGYRRGGVSGTVHFVDYDGEGAGSVEFVFPQGISASQKPTLRLSGNAADDFSWHLYSSTVGGVAGYDVYIKTPDYHVGFAFMLRGYNYTSYFVSAGAPISTPIWTSIANQETITFHKGDGSVGLGTLTPDVNYRLSVNGKIRAKEIKVETNWSDFVFEDGYKLLSLDEVEPFIAENGHLPDVPSGKVIEAEGVNVGEMESTLLRKIEELTLYIIEQNKQLKQQGEEIKKLKEARN